MAGAGQFSINDLAGITPDSPCVHPEMSFSHPT
jgi:hypothetical protein